jgi:hypothetical protein
MAPHRFYRITIIDFKWKLLKESPKNWKSGAWMGFCHEDELNI